MNGYDLENLLTEEDIIERDFRTCDCELPYVVRSRHGALGTAREIRLCCMAKKVEEMAGLPPGTFFTVIDFIPSWEWDCDQTTVTTDKDGTRHEYVLGAPPRWLLERMVRKDVPVHNLEKHPMPGHKHRERMVR